MSPLPGVCDLCEWPEAPVVVDYVFRDENVELWVDILVNGQLYAQVGPFESADERERARDDLLAMSRSVGAIDVPTLLQ